MLYIGLANQTVRIFDVIIDALNRTDLIAV